MENKFLALKKIKDFIPKTDRFFSANEEEIISGLTTDLYFVRTYEILKNKNLLNTSVLMEAFCEREGIFAGITEVLHLLKKCKVNIFSLPEGSKMHSKEVVLQIEGGYGEFGFYETAILGILASSSGWTTAAAECKLAAKDKKVICFGSRHLHPSVSPVMERCAIIGGCDGASNILGAKLAKIEPTGTVPHSAILIVGDTVKLAKYYDEIMPAETSRVILVDTLKDEVEESLRVAFALKGKLQAVRLDTPKERGGVTPELVKELREKLNQANFHNVKIFISGGLTPEKIKILSEAGADAFGVGSYISGAKPIDFTLDIKEINKKPIAKRGRLPGRTLNPKLKLVQKQI